MRILVIFLYLTSVLLASESLYISVYKETNGGYLISFPTYEKEKEIGNIFTKNKISLLFTAPREDKFSLNHYGFTSNKEFGYKKDNYFISFSLDLKYIFEENSNKEPVGFDFGNTLKFGINIK